MNQSPDNEAYLVKYVVASAVFFLIGTVHGVVQVIPPVRAWLDSIGSPYGGPGHMIDPLAHAHINLIGGVTLMVMAMGYMVLTRALGAGCISVRLRRLSFWWTTIGIFLFYLVLLVFGIWEGNLMLAGDTAAMQSVHTIYGPLVAVVASVMGIGFWLYLWLVLKAVWGRKPDQEEV